MDLYPKPKRAMRTAFSKSEQTEWYVIHDIVQILSYSGITYVARDLFRTTQCTLRPPFDEVVFSSKNF
jgi:hypothetical protein